nr:hypothetical protein Itr_chr02CG04070 [Ipomoea trifida]
MMQPYEEEITEDTKNKILAIMEEFKQDMANMREEWRQEHMTSENNCIIEDVDNACVEMPSDEIGVKEHDNFCDEPYDDSFDHNCGDAYIENVVDNVHANPLENVGDINAKHDDENCFDTCENNSFNSNDNDGLELFTFDDNSLLNEHVGELHDMLCNVDDELNVDASLLDLNEVEFDTFHDNCLDDALYIHDLIGPSGETKKDRRKTRKKSNLAMKQGLDAKLDARPGRVHRPKSESSETSLMDARVDASVQPASIRSQHRFRERNIGREADARVHLASELAPKNTAGRTRDGRPRPSRVRDIGQSSKQTACCWTRGRTRVRPASNGSAKGRSDANARLKTDFFFSSFTFADAIPSQNLQSKFFKVPLKFKAKVQAFIHSSTFNKQSQGKFHLLHIFFKLSPLL